MIWTTTAPTEPGWYWFRRPNNLPAVYQLMRGAPDAPLIVYQDDGQDWELAELVKYSEGCEWAGPILPPT